MGLASAGLPRLPQALSPLVGREREVAELTSFPLVTVTGPGGVGKTRLAVEVARSVAGEFPDGVRFVELGGVTDLSRVPGEVAAALSVQQVPGTPARWRPTCTRRSRSISIPAAASGCAIAWTRAATCAR
jgi:hypothetical protein